MFVTTPKDRSTASFQNTVFSYYLTMDKFQKEEAVSESRLLIQHDRESKYQLHQKSQAWLLSLIRTMENNVITVLYFCLHNLN